MIPLPALSLIWSQSKWVILVGALALSHYYAYSKGSESVYKAALKDVPVQVAKEQERGKEAVQRAASDVAKIKDLERQNEKLLGEFQALDRAKCSVTADELRILQQVVDQTK
jgi:hypothetical protein